MRCFIIDLIYNVHKLQTFFAPTLGQIWGKAGEKIENISWALLMEVILLTSMLWIELNVDQIDRIKSFKIHDITFELLMVNTYIWYGKFPDSIIFYNICYILIRLENSFTIFSIFQKQTFFQSKWNVYLKTRTSIFTVSTLVALCSLVHTLSMSMKILSTIAYDIIIKVECWTLKIWESSLFPLSRDIVALRELKIISKVLVFL